MANFDGVITPLPAWADIPQASNKMQLLGGPGGPLNSQALALGARTELLKNESARLSSDMAVTNARISSLVVSNNPTTDNAELIDIRTTASGIVSASAGDAVRFQSHLYNKTLVPLTLETNFYLSPGGNKVAHGSANYTYGTITLPAGEYYFEAQADASARVLFIDGKAYPDLPGSIPTQYYRTVIKVHQPTTIKVSSYVVPPLLYSVNTRTSGNSDFDEVTGLTPTSGYYMTSNGGLAPLGSYSYIDIQAKLGETYLIKGYISQAARLCRADGVTYPAVDQPIHTFVSNTVTMKADGVLRVSYENADGVSISKLRHGAATATNANSAELADARLTASGRKLSSAGAASRYQSYLYNKTPVPLTLETKFFLGTGGNKIPHNSPAYTFGTITLPVGEYYFEAQADASARVLFINGKTYPDLPGSIPTQDYRTTFVITEPTTISVSSYIVPPLLYSVNKLDGYMTDVTGLTPINGYSMNSSGALTALDGNSYVDIEAKFGETYFIKGYVSQASRLYKADGVVFPASDQPVHTLVSNTVTMKADGLLRVSYMTADGVTIRRSTKSDVLQPLLIDLDSRQKTTNAELLDIRTSANGRVLPSAGAAARFQSYLYNKTLVPLTLETNFYMHTNGNKVAHGSANYTYGTITLPAGEYYFEAQADALARVLLVDGKTYPDLSGSIPTQYFRTVLKVHQPTTIKVSSYVVPPLLYSVNTLESGNSDFDEVTGLIPTSGYYMSSSGGLVPLGSYSYIDIQAKLGETYFIKGYISQAARLCRADGVTFPAVDQPVHTLVSNTVTMKADGVLRVSYETADGVTIGKLKQDKYLAPVLSDLDNKTKLLSDHFFYRTLHRKVLALGDSLTSGGNYQSPRNGQSIEECYPYYLNLASGWIVTNGGHSGITPVGMWDSQISKGNYLGSNYDACIFWLGTNGGLTDTITEDTASGSYLTYASTNTGRYCSCIEKLLADNPKLKIYLLKVYAAGGLVVQTNQVIDKIGIKYNLPVLDPNSTGAIYPAPALHTTNAVHFDKIGNLVLANEIFKRVLSTIASNLGSYNQPLYGTRVSTIFDK
ncbi:SGNH/GDSL hydrolase family protein [Aeromonas caviae]|uniref:SGNH/GDSL hydrolase family protein n=1 Tax=Aeromonas caviae TaxID=648 RepID=UPI00214EA7AC|nr:SGNH/GDSL hydrolase family protein [Aeromonas caviae]MCR3893089.1 SGNH/GDSL hydrolase family protein [Aeromonas caviae]